MRHLFSDVFFSNRLLAVGRDALKPFEHAQHHAHRDEAEDGEHTPGDPLVREGVEHLHTEEDKEVANSGGTQPQTLADTLQMLRSNLRHERETQGRDKQLSHRQEEVGQYQYRRTRLHSHLGCLGQGFEIFARGVVVGNCDADEEDVCAR